MKLSIRNSYAKISLAAFLGISGIILGAGSCEDDYNTKRGIADAPVGSSDDTPAQVVNFPDQFMNVAFKCLGKNGIYSHTRAAAPIVIKDDSNCASK